jgi:acyl-coenzyme A synthetase/AMP-(fatty) acid ligase
MAATTRPLSRDEVVARLASRVDRAAYPRSVMIRPRLPLTASGKPDRQLLVAWWEEERDEPDESA